jgi:dienelactone hydrolase
MPPHDTNANTASSRTTKGRELVVLIHGLAGNRLVMRPLQRRLRARGYDTFNWGYRSVLLPIERNAERFRRRLDSLAERDDVERLHIVGHSMGSIITRYVAANDPPEKLGRIVLLAPPNHGSPVARWLNRGFGYLYPSLDQLSDRPQSFVNRLEDQLDAPCGVIAATRDRLVPVENTHLAGQDDHAQFKAGHTTMLFYCEVAEMVDRFLRTGRFKACRESSAAEAAEVV